MQEKNKRVSVVFVFLVLILFLFLLSACSVKENKYKNYANPN